MRIYLSIMEFKRLMIITGEMLVFLRTWYVGPCLIFDCIRALKTLRYRAVTTEQLRYFNAARYSYRLFTLFEHVCDKHFA